MAALAEAVQSVIGGLGNSTQALVHFSVELLNDGCQQALLVAKVVVQRPRVKPARAVRSSIEACANPCSLNIWRAVASNRARVSCIAARVRRTIQLFLVVWRHGVGVYEYSYRLHALSWARGALTSLSYRRAVTEPPSLAASPESDQSEYDACRARSRMR